MKAMVLAAGLGTRLRPITYDIPKPLVPVLDRPVMEHALLLLKKHGLTDVVANLHYFPDEMRAYFGDGSKWDIDLELRYEEELLGTAGGVRNVRDHFGDEPFAIVSGDALTDIDLSKFVEAHKRCGGIATLALKRVDDTREYGVVVLDDDGRIEGFQEKPDPEDALSNLANCGIYIFDPEIFDYFPETDFADWAQDVFPALLERDAPFYGHEVAGYWNDVGSLEEYRAGNYDALVGEVEVEIDLPRVSEGIYVGEGTDLSGAEADPPVFIGPGCKVGIGVRLTGPVVVGSGCTIGDGSYLRDVIIWHGTEVARESLVVGAVLASRGALPV